MLLVVAVTLGNVSRIVLGQLRVCKVSCVCTIKCKKKKDIRTSLKIDKVPDQGSLWCTCTEVSSGST